MKTCLYFVYLTFKYLSIVSNFMIAVGLFVFTNYLLYKMLVYFYKRNIDKAKYDEKNREETYVEEVDKIVPDSNGLSQIQFVLDKYDAVTKKFAIQFTEGIARAFNNNNVRYTLINSLEPCDLDKNGRSFSYKMDLDVDGTHFEVCRREVPTFFGSKGCHICIDGAKFYNAVDLFDYIKDMN